MARSDTNSVLRVVAITLVVFFVARTMYAQQHRRGTDTGADEQQQQQRVRGRGQGLRRMVPKVHADAATGYDAEPVAYNDPDLLENTYSPAAFTSNLTNVNDFYAHNKDLLENAGRFPGNDGITNSGEWEIQAQKMAEREMSLGDGANENTVNPYSATDDDVFGTSVW
jgi:hypothetical protein